MTGKNRRPRPHPSEWRVHSPIGDDTLGALVPAGGAYLNTETYRALLSTAGVRLLRLRVATSGAGEDGTLSFKWVRPTVVACTDSPDYYTDNPANVAHSGGTESVVDIDVRGEALLEVTWDPSADGTMLYADVMGL